jgi:hypothetical protein
MPDMSNPSVSYPRSAVMFHRYAKVVVGVALIVGHIVGQDFACYVYQNLAGNGDTFTHQFSLAAGSYTLNVLGWLGPDRGKVDWYIDGVLAVSGQDWYAGGYTYNVVKTSAVTVASSGLHVLKGVVNGHTVPSTGYYIVLTSISLS